jgi:hypothetical protein
MESTHSYSTAPSPLARLSRCPASRSAWHYDIHKSLESLPSEKPKPSLILRAEDVITSRELESPKCKDCTDTCLQSDRVAGVREI